MRREMLVPSFLFLLNSCIDLSNNKNEIIKQEIGGGGTSKCLLFIKSGGATVGDAYHISVLPHHRKLKDSDVGNIFIADDHDDGISSDTSGVNFKWLNLDSLKISFDKSLRVFKRDTVAKGITIIYDSVSLTR